MLSLILLVVRPSYSVVDLHIRNTDQRRLYLNNRGTIIARGVETDDSGKQKQQLPSVFVLWKGRRIDLGSEASEVAGLNEKEEAVLKTNRGIMVWKRGKIRILPPPKMDGGFDPWLGQPVGIDDSGRIVCVADEVEGVYFVHFLPALKSNLHFLPRPIAMAGDGAFCGMKSHGRSPYTEGPTAFVCFKDATTPIGGKEVMFPTCVSSVTHWVGGWSEKGDPGRRRPFLWHNGTLNWLPWHRGDQDSAVVNAVNTSGVAVGEVAWTYSEPGISISMHHAALWKDGALIDLNDCLPPDSPFELQSAEAINDQGQILVTAGMKDHIRWAPTILLLTPPPAATVTGGISRKVVA